MVNLLQNIANYISWIRSRLKDYGSGSYWLKISDLQPCKKEYTSFRLQGFVSADARLPVVPSPRRRPGPTPFSSTQPLRQPRFNPELKQQLNKAVVLHTTTFKMFEEIDLERQVQYVNVVQ